MPANIVVFDIETKLSFDEVGGRNNLAALGISVLGMYDYLDDSYKIYCENELDAFIERLSKKPMLVGFNSKKFDIPVLKAYAKGFALNSLSHLDIMEEVQKALGHRLSLQSIASATLGLGKTGSGLDALKYFREGNFDKLKKYCLNDVKITKDIYEHGANNKELYYTPKFGTGKARVEVNWSAPNSEAQPSQYDLF